MATAQFLTEMTAERDHLELSLGDTLDVKAGILLAVITILGSLTAALITTPNLSKGLSIAQMASLGLLVVGCVFAILALFPRNYLLPNLPSKYAEWAEKLQQYYERPEEAEAQATQDLTRVANQRIERNHKLNSAKSRYLHLSFWPTLLALAIDIGTLGYLGALKILS